MTGHSNANRIREAMAGYYWRFTFAGLPEDGRRGAGV